MRLLLDIFFSIALFAILSSATIPDYYGSRRQPTEDTDFNDDYDHHQEDTSYSPETIIANMFGAIATDDLKNVKKWLNYKPFSGMASGIRNATGFTPIHVAAAHNAEKTFDWLICRNATVDEPNSSGDLPLHLACQYSSKQLIMKLLRANKSATTKMVNFQNQLGQVPLHSLAKRNPAKGATNLMASVLLNHCANQTIRDNRDMLPIHEAIVNKNVALVKYLLQISDSDPESLRCCGKQSKTISHLVVEHAFEGFLVDEKGLFRPYFNDSARDGLYQTPICYAIHSDFLDVMLHWVFWRYKSVPKHLVTNRLLSESNCTYQAVTGMTQQGSALHLASLLHLTSGVKSLLDRADANASLRDSLGGTPLHALALLSDNVSAPKICDESVASGFNPKAPLSQNCKPALGILKENNLDIILSLRRKDGGIVFHVDRAGRTPFLVAVANAAIILADDLVGIFGAEKEACDSKGYCALHLASDSQTLKLLKKLFSQKSFDIEIQTKGNAKLTPLLVAVIERKSLDFISYLITDEKANIKAVDFYGRGIAHLAVIANYLQLLESKSDLLDLCSQDNDGLTPLRFTIEKADNLEAARLLILADKTGCSLSDDVPSKKEPLLHVAIRKGFTQLVGLMLNRNLRLVDSVTGRNPLHAAILHRQWSIAENLVANFPQMIIEKDNHGRNPLHAAIIAQCEVSSDEVDNLALDRLLRGFYDSKRKQVLFDLNTESLLRLAVDRNCPQLVLLLLNRYHANCSQLDEDEGLSVLHQAKIKGFDSLFSDMINSGKCDRNVSDACGNPIPETVKQGQIFTCPPITGALFHGNISISSRCIGSVGTLSCQRNYSLVGDNHIKCQSNGQWIISGQCVPDCGSAPNVTNGKFVANESATGFASSVKSLECNEGYEVDGASMIFCQLNGEWSPTLARCVFSCDAMKIDLQRQMGQAALKGNVTGVKKLLALGCLDVNWRDEMEHSACGRTIKDGSVLHRALQCNDSTTEMVKLLISAGADVNLKESSTDRTPLISAAYDGNLDIVRLLLAMGADADATNENGDTALTLAVFRGYTEIVRLLLAMEVNINVKNKADWTVLTLAAYENYPQIAQLLLDRGADRTRYEDYLNKCPRCPKCQWSASSGHCLPDCGSVPKVSNGKFVTSTWPESGRSLECDDGYEGDGPNVIICLSNGHWSEPGKCLPIPGCTVPQAANGQFFLIIASERERLEAGEHMSLGDSITLQCNGGYEPRAKATDSAVVTCQPNGQWSPTLAQCAVSCSTSKPDLQLQLVRASSQGNVTGVKRLIGLGCVDVNWRHEVEFRHCGKTIKDAAALHRTIQCNRGSAPEIARLLIEAGADIDMKERDTGDTPLILAASLGNAETVGVLLEKEAAVDAKNDGDETALIRAVSGNHEEVVKLLLDHNADPNAQDKNAWRPLLLAAESNLVEIVKLLLARNAKPNVNADTPFGTPLIRAAINNHKAIATMLLDAGANVDAKDDEGQTALIRAACNGHVEMVRLLLEGGANVKETANNGGTVLSFAFTKNRMQITQLLKSKNPQGQYQGLFSCPSS